MSGHVEVSDQIEVTGPAGRGVAARHTALLIYAMVGGVSWWSAHLIALASTAPAVCNGSPAWILSLINAVCLIGVVSTVVAAVMTRRAQSELDKATGRSMFVGYVALGFNLAATMAVIMESIPVYVLGACQ